MKTFPLAPTKNGRLFAFEVENVYISVSAIVNVLRITEGVTDVERRRPFSRDGEVHVKFKYQGNPCIVWEPFGDSSRYWIGPENVSLFDRNMAQIENAFKNYLPPIHRTILGKLLTFRFAGH